MGDFPVSMSRQYRGNASKSDAGEAPRRFRAERTQTYVSIEIEEQRSPRPISAADRANEVSPACAVSTIFLNRGFKIGCLPEPSGASA